MLRNGLIWSFFLLQVYFTFSLSNRGKKPVYIGVLMAPGDCEIIVSENIPPHPSGIANVALQFSSAVPSLPYKCFRSCYSVHPDS